jgi:ElaB/YqjD/DUF883 family membrane-anchored ribosome-binding protein
MSMETDRIEDDVNQSRHRLNETLSELGSKLSPGQMLDEGLGLLRGQAGHFAGKLGRQVRDNPLPVLLIGAGIAWLVVANRQAASSSDVDREEEEAYHQRRYRTIEEARWATPRMPSETDEAYEERVHQAYGQALGLKQLAGEAVHEFKERVKRTVEGIQYAATRAGGRIGRTFSGTGRRLGNTYSGARDKLGGAYAGTREKLGSFATSSRERLGTMATDAKLAAEEQAQRLGHAAEEARHRAERFYDETPLAAGAIALAVGALVGSLTPLSQPERRTLRGVADRAARTGADLAERGVRAVDERLDGSLH